MKQIKMLLDRDEFLVTYDAAKADTKLLLRAVKASGYTAQVVTGDTATATAVAQVLPTGFAVLDEALAKAKAENKPIVLDLFAEWCAPCRQLERVTFPAPAVKALLERTIFLRIDTDKFPDLAQRLGVEGLPDIRLALPDGTIVRQLRSFQTAESLANELEKLLQQIK